MLFPAGGFKACISPLVAEQYKVTAPRVKTLKSGERVIVDPSYTTARHVFLDLRFDIEAIVLHSITSIYMWFYLLINVGALVGQIGMTYAEKYVGFWLAYTLPTIVFFLCPIVLWIGRNRYVRSPPQGSVLSSAIHIWGQGLKGTWSWNPVKTWKAWMSPDFWERARPAAVIASHGGVRPSWLTYNDVFVDEVRRGLKACQVFLFFPLYWIAYNQINNSTSPSVRSLFFMCATDLDGPCFLQT